ncbi:uncharacterized protein GIQ15_03895 [Arthroderma uncinatum]|uniref:uncharacterized protein n=1 Tax=Arthroderma uncinatum TaxID=74035 RepID=UPI00144AA870|nr:uncharacterized protein GIQ15_03895 [Arthroderma uncinatum]KAF3481136.1 hypothetical protein GIQ15_03895 [Arthroderma uncinatum]
MEATIFDESMEMAPDTTGYFDTHDDIEIELDGLRDPNHDEDVIVDDASMVGSEHPGMIGDTHEPVKDADMMDDEFHEESGSLKEAEEDYQFIDDALDMDHQSYEMEEDYEEDIDAPIPGTSVMETGVPADKVLPDEMPEEYPAPENHKEEDVETDIQVEPLEENVSSAPKEENEEVHTSADIEQPEILAQDGSNEPEQFDNEVDQASTKESFEHEEPSHEIEVQADASTIETLDEADQEAAKERPSNGQKEKESDESELSALHNVQVLYQDSEISLFPPKEDDLSETYFLEDEALAHEPIGDLLNACRSVLGDHMGKDEELFIEIECLGLHVTEATRSSISLSQIVQVYLDLSRNDGDTNPGPLYISLATQPTFTQNFASILEAAQAGKGLSHVGKWDEYEDQIVFEEHENARDSSQEDGQAEPTEDVENTANKPEASLGELENEHEKVGEEATGVNEGIELNSKENEVHHAPTSPPTPAAEDFEATNLETNNPEPELEEVVDGQAGNDEGTEQKITDQNTDLGQIEEPTDEDVRGEDEVTQPPIAANEEAEPPVPDPSQDTNTEPTSQVAAAPDMGEEFIQIDLETFEDELHDGESLADGNSTLPAYEQPAEPSTPEPTYNPLEIDEDIFKSPTAPPAGSPHKSLEDLDGGPSEEVAPPAEIHDEYKREPSIPESQNGEDASTAGASPVGDRTQDFIPEQDVDSANGDDQLEIQPEFKLDPRGPMEKDGENIFAESAVLEAGWPQDNPDGQGVVDLEEMPQTEILHGYDLDASDLADNNGETAGSATLEDGSNETFQNGSASKEQSPKAAKRPCPDEELNILSNPVPVLKKHRSE